MIKDILSYISGIVLALVVVICIHIVGNFLYLSAQDDNIAIAAPKISEASMVEEAEEVVEAIEEEVEEAIEEAVEEVAEAAEEAVEEVRESAELVVDKVQDAAEEAVEEVAEAAETIKEVVADSENSSNSAGGSSSILEQIKAADETKGKKVFAKCKACHTIDKGGKKRVGPNLYNIIGAEIAANEGFTRYSKGMKAFADENGKWTLELLYNYLEKPNKMVKKTTMAFPGLKKEADRANIVLYIRNQSDNPASLD